MQFHGRRPSTFRSCNDQDKSVHRGQPEDLTNRMDDDCDGLADNPKKKTPRRSAKKASSKRPGPDTSRDPRETPLALRDLDATLDRFLGSIEHPVQKAIAPHAIVMNTNGKSGPLTIGPPPWMNGVTFGIWIGGFTTITPTTSSAIVPIFM